MHLCEGVIRSLLAKKSRLKFGFWSVEYDAKTIHPKKQHSCLKWFWDTKILFLVQYKIIRFLKALQVFLRGRLVDYLWESLFAWLSSKLLSEDDFQCDSMQATVQLRKSVLVVFWAPNEYSLVEGGKSVSVHGWLGVCSCLVCELILVLLYLWQGGTFNFCNWSLFVLTDRLDQDTDK